MKEDDQIRYNNIRHIVISSIIIIFTSVGFGLFYAIYEKALFGLIIGLGMGISGFFLAILPNILFLRSVIKENE